jgi:hypothetical protein
MSDDEKTMYVLQINDPSLGQAAPGTALGNDYWRDITTVEVSKGTSRRAALQCALDENEGIPRPAAGMDPFVFRLLDASSAQGMRVKPKTTLEIE